MARTAALALATLTLTACPEVVTPDDIIEVAPGLPQGSEAPTGDPNSPLLPQIETLSAPETVRPGQVVTIRLSTNFKNPALIDGVGIVVEGVNGWFIAEASPRPGGESDGGLWIVDLQIVIAEGIPEGVTKKIEFALLGPANQPGGYREWNPVVGPGWAGQLRGRGRRGLQRAQLRPRPHLRHLVRVVRGREQPHRGRAV